MWKSDNVALLWLAVLGWHDVKCGGGGGEGSDCKGGIPASYKNVLNLTFAW